MNSTHDASGGCRFLGYHVAWDEFRNYFTRLGQELFPSDEWKAVFCAEAFMRLFTPVLSRSATHTFHMRMNSRNVGIDPVYYELLEFIEIQLIRKRNDGMPVPATDAAARLKEEMIERGPESSFFVPAALVNLFYINNNDRCTDAVYRYDTVIDWIKAYVDRADCTLGTLVCRRLSEYFGGIHNVQEMCRRAEQSRSFRIKSLVRDYDYTCTDPKIDGIDLHDGRRFVRLLTLRALKTMGEVLQNCIRHGRIEERVGKINYEKLMRDGAAQYFVLCGVSGAMHTCVMVERVQGRDTIVEIGEKQNGKSVIYTNYVLAFKERNNLPLGRVQHRTGLVYTQRGLIRTIDLQRGDVVPGDLSLCASEQNISLEGVTVTGTLDISDSPDITHIPGVTAKTIIARQCMCLSKIMPEARADVLYIDRFPLQIPAQSDIKKVMLFSGNADVHDPVTLSWKRYVRESIRMRETGLAFRQWHNALAFCLRI